MDNIIKNKRFDEERALYNLKDTEVNGCVFAGENDGESVLKEARNIVVSNCSFSLRYPLWHVKKYELLDSSFDGKTRAPIWYSDDGIIKNCSLNGVKMLRECNNTSITKSNIVSPEFGWKCNNVEIVDSSIESEYIFLDSKEIKLQDVRFKGKYEEWIKFFLKGIIEIAANSIDTITKIVLLKEEVNNKINSLTFKNKDTYFNVVNYLYRRPYFTSNDLIDEFKLTKPTVSKIINELVELGIVVPTSSKQRYVTYKYERYVEILERGTEI